jgi:hypothetical protein
MRNPAKLTYSTLIATGTVALAISIIYTSSVLAFIGLGLVFWGITFAYIRTEEYVKKALLTATMPPQITNLNKIMQGMECEGNAIYLPPKYFRNPETSKAYVPKRKGTKLPTLENTQEQDSQFFINLIENLPAVLLTPPGAELTKLFEKTIKTDFAKIDLQYLQRNMPKLLIEELEICQDFEMEIENNTIRVKIENSVYNTSDMETQQSLGIYSALGSPLSTPSHAL